MKHILIFLTMVLSQDPMDDGFVDIVDVIQNISIDVRYYSDDNFVGKRVDGYFAEKIFMTKEAALALKKVQSELNTYGLGLKIFDAYRPQRAVDHFVRWAKDLDDTLTKKKYYPNETKSVLFKKGYIASRSGHTRGSTIDLTIVVLDNNDNAIEELDMGTPWDFFSPKSATAYSELTTVQRKNRLLLKSVMEKNGFKNYSKEWWHFTLSDEPFPNTYFDFIIK